ncbi:MAG: hypothetical protein EP326_11185 [Deltaproteobacteria bacterium]|nr:MAG: hypothetical protein EP326_11185 [Deltaproteobacteria bacterium]
MLRMILVTLLITFSANTFAQTNMILPLLHCEKDSNDSQSETETLTLMTDIESIFTRSISKAVIVMGTKEINIHSSAFGTFDGSTIQEDQTFKGDIFKSDLVVYNHKIKYSMILTLNGMEATLTRKMEDPNQTNWEEKFSCRVPLP